MSGKTLLPFLLYAFLVGATFAAIQEPWIKIVDGFFEKEDCAVLIEAAEAHGFPLAADSIDYNDPMAVASWEIDVYMLKELRVPSIASLYEKYLVKLRDFVSAQKIELNNDHSEPILDWVFLRKYAADGERQMLKLHRDVNLFTVNIALNDDFEGGGFFYHKNEDSYFQGDDPRPNIPREKLDYEYLAQIKRQNTSLIVFPDSKAGSLLIHNYTLFHAIAPVEKGTRYSLIFFYDMHHPEVARFYPKNFDVVVQNDFEFPVDLYHVESNKIERTLQLVLEEITAKRFSFSGRTGERYEVLDSRTRALLQVVYLSSDVIEGTDYNVRLGRDADSESIQIDDLNVVAEIVNKFTYPVSLVWVNAIDESDPRPVLVDQLESVRRMSTQNGERFEIVKQGTNQVVDYFTVKTEYRQPGFFVVTVGPDEKPQIRPINARVVNRFQFEVSLYWVYHQAGGPTRELVQSSITDFFRFETILGHTFEVVIPQTGDVLATFEIEDGYPGPELVFTVGPEKLIPNKGSHQNYETRLDYSDEL